jgi:hypothetical protein
MRGGKPRSGHAVGQARSCPTAVSAAPTATACEPHGLRRRGRVGSGGVARSSGALPVPGRGPYGAIGPLDLSPLALAVHPWPGHRARKARDAARTVPGGPAFTRPNFATYMGTNLGLVLRVGANLGLVLWVGQTSVSSGWVGATSVWSLRVGANLGLSPPTRLAQGCWTSATRRIAQYPASVHASTLARRWRGFGRSDSCRAEPFVVRRRGIAAQLSRVGGLSHRRGGGGGR